MEQIKNIITFFQNIQKNQVIDILIAIAIVILFSMGSSIISYLIVKMFNLKEKHKKKIKFSPWYKLIKTLLICLGVYLGIIVLSLPEEIKITALKLFRIFAIVLTARAINNFFNPKEKIFVKLKESDRFSGDQTLVNFISKIVKCIVYVIAAFLIITELGYDLSGLITGLGLGGVVIALAAQDIAKNLFGGVAIITDKPFIVGDYIETDKYQGTVEDITFRSTRIRTNENTLVTIPNSTLSNASITNWSKLKKRRFDVDLNLPLDTNSEKVENIISKLEVVLNSSEEVVKDSVKISFNKITKEGLNIWIYLYTTNTVYDDYFKFKQEINDSILKVLESEQIKLAYSGRSVYIHE